MLVRYLALIPLIAMLVLPGSPQRVYLTFDVELPDTPEDIAQLLSILDTHNVKATFFVLGDFAERYPDTVEAIIKAGHELGYHTKSHRVLTGLGEEDMMQELKKPYDSIKGFRAPWNKVNKRVFELLKVNGYGYDSSLYDGFSIQPSNGIRELKISSWFGLPLSDTMFLYYLKLPWLYRWIIARVKTRDLVLEMHPHIILMSPESLVYIIEHFKPKAEFERCEDAF
ncbi:polysaccharide deacetylase family protein [Candidatus Woesearchaeota archaeon]|nr:polysaccharide deacetylase family protein [Candidatus Woesearchaeota archaeon]